MTKLFTLLIFAATLAVMAGLVYPNPIHAY